MSFVYHLPFQHMFLSDGTGEPNPEGIEYYNRLIDSLIDKGQSIWKDWDIFTEMIFTIPFILVHSFFCVIIDAKLVYGVSFIWHAPFIDEWQFDNFTWIKTKNECKWIKEEWENHFPVFCRRMLCCYLLVPALHSRHFFCWNKRPRLRYFLW